MRHGGTYLPSDLRAITLPLVTQVHFTILYPWAGINYLLRRFEFPALTRLCVDCSDHKSYWDTLDDIKRFFERQSATVSDLTVQFPWTITEAGLLSASFQSLRRLGTSHLHELDAHKLPASLEDLGVWLVMIPANTFGMPNQDFMFSTSDKQWELLDEILVARLPLLKSIRCLKGRYSALDWMILGHTVRRETAERFRTMARALKDKDIDLFDIHGRTYTCERIPFH